jgi:hypothetical protein
MTVGESNRVDTLYLTLTHTFKVIIFKLYLCLIYIFVSHSSRHTKLPIKD